MIRLEPVKLVRDAIMAYCVECDTYIEGNVYWDWTKSRWLHESGTGHKKYLRLAYVEVV